MVDDLKKIVENDKEMARRKKVAEIRKRQNSQAHTYIGTDNSLRSGEMSRPRSNTTSCTSTKVKKS